MKKKLVVLTGAGVSAESGIATFRDSGGLWDKYPVEEVATPEGYAKNPQLVLDFYNLRRKELLNTKPNKAHFLLADLEKDFDVTIITQNIDNLHEQAGSTKVIHLHGELMKGCSSYNPNDPKCIVNLNPKDPNIIMGDKAKDGSQLRPYIVWFGEAVPAIEIAIKFVEKADLFLVIGTSLNVYPAAGLLHYVPAKSPIYLIDPKPVNASLKVIHIEEVATKGMDLFIKMTKKMG